MTKLLRFTNLDMHKREACTRIEECFEKQSESRRNVLFMTTMQNIIGNWKDRHSRAVYQT